MLRVWDTPAVPTAYSPVPSGSNSSFTSGASENKDLQLMVKGCRFSFRFVFAFLGDVFFVFQSGALFLAMCYILGQKPVLC